MENNKTKQNLDNVTIMEITPVDEISMGVVSKPDDQKADECINFQRNQCICMQIQYKRFKNN